MTELASTLNQSEPIDPTACPTCTAATTLLDELPIHGRFWRQCTGCRLIVTFPAAVEGMPEPTPERSVRLFGGLASHPATRDPMGPPPVDGTCPACQFGKRSAEGHHNYLASQQSKLQAAERAGDRQGVGMASMVIQQVARCPAGSQRKAAAYASFAGGSQ